jgi:DNA-directed RNA polymerase
MPRKSRSFEELGASLGRDGANVTRMKENTVLDTAAATRAKVEKAPYSVRKVGREALKLWIKPLAKYLAQSTPPRGFEQVIRGLDHKQLALLGLRAILHRIHIGWGRRKGKRGREHEVKNPNMLFCVELGQTVGDELEFAHLLGAEKYAKAVRKKHDVLGWLKFRRVDWTRADCARVGDWLWDALAEMSCFDVDERGYPKLRADHKAALDRFAEEVLYDHPLYKPRLAEPPPWTSWRVECPGDIAATFVSDGSDLKTIEKVWAAFADGSIEPHARAVSAIQRVPLKINAALLPLVREFAGDEYRRDVVVAEALVDEPRFWNRVRCDWRGRLIQMSDFNYTRSDPVRSLFMFAEGEQLGVDATQRALAKLGLHGQPLGVDGKCTGRPIDWLEVEVANAYGVKGTWADRRNWVAKKKELVKAVAADPARIWRRRIGAAEPFRFAAACLEYVAADTQGSTYLTHLPCWLDASSNGLQHIAIMTRDVKLAERVNLKVRATEGDPKIHDVYKIVGAPVRQSLRADGDPSLRLLLAHEGALRTVLKRPIMTLPYGVTKSGMLTQIKEECAGLGIVAPFEVLVRLRDRVWTAIQEELPGALAAQEYIQGIALYCLDRGTYMQWTTPSGFPVSNRYCKSKTHRVRLPFLGQSVTIADGYTNKPVKQDIKNGAVANFTHSMDAAHLALSVNEAVASGITNIMTVHDCFGAPAPSVQLFGKIRRERLCVMAVYNSLEKLRDANLPLPDFDADFDIVRLAESEYFDR